MPAAELGVRLTGGGLGADTADADLARCALALLPSVRYADDGLLGVTSLLFACAPLMLLPSMAKMAMPAALLAASLLACSIAVAVKRA